MNAAILAVRQLLPTSILIYYDQRRSRDRIAIASVQRGICGGCHIAMSRGGAAELRRSDRALQICESCGAYVYLADSERSSTRVPIGR